MSPAPKRELAEMRDRLVREVERVIGATDGLTADERHILVNVAGRKPGGTRDEEFAARADIADIRARWAVVRQGIADVLDNLPPGRLDEDLVGPVSTSSVHAMVVHSIAHAAEHAGQAELTRDLLKERG